MSLGLNQVVADFTKAGLTAGIRALKVVEETTAEVVASAKASAPVDTGEYRDSISGDISRTGSEIGPTDPNRAKVLAIEHGTSRMGPQPVMGPAIDKHIQGFVDRLEQLAGDI